MRASRLSLVFLSLGLAGCAAEADFGEPTEAVASTELAIGGPIGGPGCDLSKLHNLRWSDIPLNTPTLEIHTCDLSGAGTNDDVEVHFQVGNKTYDQWLDSAHDDFERNQTSQFKILDLGGKLTQMKDVNLIKVEKHGNDQWCFDRIALKQGGAVVWEYNAAVDDHSSQPGVPMSPISAPGPIWLDDQSHDARAYEVTFTDRQILYTNRANHGSLDLEIKTCSIDTARDADSHSRVRVRWSHDGIIEPVQDLRVDYRPYNFFETQHLADNVSIERLTMSLEALGDDNWCVESVRVLANGHPIGEPLQLRRLFSGLGGENDHQDNWDKLPLYNGLVIETGNRIGQLGRPISGNFRQGSITAGFGIMPDATYPFCAPPRIATHDDIVRLIEANFVKKGRPKHASFNDGDYVTVTREASDTAHVAMRFHADAPGSGDAKIWMSFDLRVDCIDEDPDPVKKKEKLKFFFEHVEKSYDVPPLLDLAGWFVNLFGNFDKMVKGMIPDPPPFLELPGTCPDSFSFDANANLSLDWPALKLPNAMCKADSADWEALKKCHVP